MSQIFLKLDTVDILGSAQWVCSSWWKLSKQPHLFRSIYVVYVEKDSICNLKLWRKMAREAIDRSCGELVEFSVGNIANDDLLHYMSEKTSSLRSLRLRNNEQFAITTYGLIELAKKLPRLEELEIIQRFYSDFPSDVIKTFGRFCPQLKSFRLNYMSCLLLYEEELDEVALAIAKNMSELRHLNLFGISVTSDVLRTILNGCPHLESLDLRQCFDLEFAEDLKERCKNIRELRLPMDPIDDFEYKCHNDPTQDEYGTYSPDHDIYYGLNADDEIYASDVDSDYGIENYYGYPYDLF